jgi:hypothetical protein
MSAPKTKTPLKRQRTLRRDHPLKLLKGALVMIPHSAAIWRDANDEDTRAWRESPASKGMTDAGETRLMSPSIYLPRDAGTSHDAYRVIRSRVAPMKGWRKASKCVEICAADGTLWYAHRRHCHVVAGPCALWGGYPQVG